MIGVAIHYQIKISLIFAVDLQLFNLILKVSASDSHVFSLKALRHVVAFLLGII